MTDTITLPRETVQQALAALTDTVRWRLSGIGRPPEQTAIDAMTAIGAALQQAEPQAQAGEPEVVAWRTKVHRTNGNEYLAYTERCVFPNLPESSEPLITLQAHREAMAEVVGRWTRESEVFQDLLLKLEGAMSRLAKKDAALKACVEALEMVDAADNDRDFLDASEWPALDAAIAQAQEAMK